MQGLTQARILTMLTDHLPVSVTGCQSAKQFAATVSKLACIDKQAAVLVMCDTQGWLHKLYHIFSIDCK